MRKLNSKFNTSFISEAGTLLENKDYFAFTELDNCACYVIADGIDDDLEIKSAQIAVTSIIRSFIEKPSVKKSDLKGMLHKANEELISRSREVRLKASVMVVVTDYQNITYASAGNARMYLYRDGFLRYKSKDQSLTQLLSEEEEVALDKIAQHKERNNLYCYLGQPKLDKLYISPKIKLADGDIITLLTRGIWENVDDQEITDALDEAKEPKEVINNIEDMLLSKQLNYIENYTLSMIFVDKVYINPNKKTWIKKAIIASIPIIIMIIIALVIWNINRNKKINSINEMNSHKISASQYIANGNIPRTNEEYKAALDIAQKYKLKSEKDKLDRCYKYTELILDGDAKLKEKKYEEALDQYLAALDKSDSVDNIGKQYILDKLEITRKSIKVIDLLTLGDKELEVGNVGDAEAAYKQAKDLATDFYLKDERKEAMDKLQQLSEKKATDEKQAKEEEDKTKKEAEEAEKEKLDIESKAVENIKKADVSYIAADYTSAKMYYMMAKQMYKQIGSDEIVNELEEKIQLMNRKINESANNKVQADKYSRDGDDKYIKGDYSSAKVLYLLACDIYEKEKNTESVKKVKEKLDLVDKAMSKQ